MEKPFQKLTVTFVFPITLAIVSGLLAFPVMAQIVPDTSLPGNSRVVVESNVSTITGGTLAGRNLFHSFDQFSVLTNGTAYFNNSQTVQNIISRVTGKSVSNIDGLIKANESANLFLLNPNGIIFGPNSSLDIKGSFLATTANALRFGALGSFSASTPNNPELLTINPSALLFNQIAAESVENQSRAFISNQSGELKVRDDRSLLLIGRDVSMNGGRLTARGGRVELAGVAGAGSVGLNQDQNGKEWRLAVPDGLARADVSLSKAAQISVAGAGGGSIAINARSLEMSGGSRLDAGIAKRLGTKESQAGDIRLNTTDAISLTGKSQINNIVDVHATGNGGNIEVKAGSLSILEGSQLNTTTFGKGNSGSVIITARNITANGDSSEILSRLGANKTITDRRDQDPTKAEGNGGNIIIKANSLSLLNKGRLSASTYGYGNAGNIEINADTITMNGNSSDISSNVDKEAVIKKNGEEGEIHAGKIDIHARNLVVENGARIRANTEGPGNAGKIKVTANTITLKDTGSIIESNVGVHDDDDDKKQQNANTKGDSGGIEIEAESLSVRNGAQLRTDSYAQGDAGNIRIDAREIVLDHNNRTLGTHRAISSSVFKDAHTSQDRREIRITADTLDMRNTAQILADNEGNGNAGNIVIEARKVSLDGSIPSLDRNGKVNGRHATAIFSRVLNNGMGDGGSIDITSKELSITNGAGIFAAISGETPADNSGSIKIASDRVTLAGRGTHDATSGIFGNLDENGKGKGASINIEAGSLLLTDGARLFSTTTGTGSAGNVTVISPNQIMISNGAGVRVSSLRDENAGNIVLQTNLLTLKDQGFIQSNSASGQQAGNIDLDIGKLLLLRQKSEISTSAGTAQARGNGGNITIRTPLLVAIPNEDSNIIANAYTGKGGNVTITTQGLIGFQRQLQNPSLSRISASSTFGLNGQVNLNVLSVDPSQGLVSLPTVTVDASRLITRQCSPSRVSGEINQFVITGRGGLPAAPSEQLRSSSVLTPWVNLPSDAATSPVRNSEGLDTRTSLDAVPQSSNRADSPLERLVEAQEWVKDAQGNVALVAQVPSDSSVPVSSVPCHGF